MRRWRPSRTSTGQQPRRAAGQQQASRSISRASTSQQPAARPTQQPAEAASTAGLRRQAAGVRRRAERLRPRAERRPGRLRRQRHRLRRPARDVRPADGVRGAAAPGVRRPVLRSERRPAAERRVLRERRSAAERRLRVERRLPGPRVCGARPGGAARPGRRRLRGLPALRGAAALPGRLAAAERSHDGYQNGYPDQYAPEAESAQAADAGEQNRVGFDRPGPAPSASHALTEAGLPRRGSTASGANGTGAAKQDAPAPPPESGGGTDVWRSANDERWQQASRSEEAQGGRGHLLRPAAAGAQGQPGRGRRREHPAGRPTGLPRPGGRPRQVEQPATGRPARTQRRKQ